MRNEARTSKSSSRARASVTVPSAARTPFLSCLDERKIGKVVKSFQRYHEAEAAPLIAMLTATRQSMHRTERQQAGQLRAYDIEPLARHQGRAVAGRVHSIGRPHRR